LSPSRTALVTRPATLPSSSSSESYSGSSPPSSSSTRSERLTRPR